MTSSRDLRLSLDASELEMQLIDAIEQLRRLPSLREHHNPKSPMQIEAAPKEVD
jgi:hypothetical protein